MSRLAPLVVSALLVRSEAAGSSLFSKCKDFKATYAAEDCCGMPEKEVGFQVVPNPKKRLTGTNKCDGMKPSVKNFECIVDGVLKTIEQAGGDVTKGFKGGLNTSGRVPIDKPYYQTALCPVNVHWHLGAEHRSEGEFDETGVSPNLAGVPADKTRRLADDTVRYGYACKKYDANDARFTTEYKWQHCVGMQVGETYEVHWPHSTMGACGTPNQYQSPFYDGVFCHFDTLLNSQLPAAQAIAENVGVQGQVFTIINDEDYYYPNLIRGMIVDKDNNMGQDVAAYTGSTTGTSRNNQVCSGYAPITWQVDRKCHLISASTFDKMCADMKQMRDDMSQDLHAHGSRELVWKNMTADNQMDMTSHHR
jgi:hypothetical protein